MSKIQIMIVDDHPLMREGLRRVLSLEPDMVVVFEASNGQEATEVALRFKPDVILMDINMPGVDGIAATRLIRQENPNVGIIALTIHDDDVYVLELLRAGASGYMLKDVESDVLVQAIRAVAKGATVLHPSLTKKILGGIKVTDKPEPEEKLTAREREILLHVVHGETNGEIAQSLFISEKTVKNHLSNVFRKLSVEDRTQAALYAIKHNLASN